MSTETTRSSSNAPDAPSNTITTSPLPVSLPDGYLATGYFKGAGPSRYIDPALVSTVAEQIAAALAAGGLKASAFRGYLRDLKKAKRASFPLEARYGALLALRPKALLVAAKKPALRILVEIVEKNLESCTNDDDFEALFTHFEAISAFLGVKLAEAEQARPEGGDICA